MRHQAFSRIAFEETRSLVDGYMQPLVVLIRPENDQHALFVIRLVEARHKWMAVCIDCQHRKRQQRQSVWAVLLVLP